MTGPFHCGRLLSGGLALFIACGASAVPPDLVGAQGDEFVKDGRTFRFVGMNIRGLVHYGGGDGALPYTNLGHVDENLAAAEALGCRVIRVFAANRNVTTPQAVARLGYALDKAEQYGQKLIIALTDFYPTPFHPAGDDGYYTVNPWGWTVLNEAWFGGGYQVHYLPYVTAAVSAYKDHPAVFSWQIGNELAAQTNPALFAPFVQAVAAHIKGIDPHHMVSTGILSIDHNPLARANAIALYQDPHLDFLTLHAYNGDQRPNDLIVHDVVHKPLVVSEIGCDAAAAGGDRVAFIDQQYGRFVTQCAARGFMNWGFQSQAWDIGDGDNSFGIDRYAHPDYAAMTAYFQARAADANNHVVAANRLWPRGRNLLATAAAWQADTVHSAPYGPQKSFDGDLATKWTSTNAAASHWIAVDLGEELVVTGFRVYHAAAGGEVTFFNHQAYALQHGESLEGPWSPLLIVNNTIQRSALTHRLEEAVRARYLRLEVTDCGVDRYARLPEWIVYGDAPPRPDLDGDNDVDLADYAYLQRCYGLAGDALAERPECAVADVTLEATDPSNGDVDERDAAVLGGCIAGPGAAAPTSCY